MLCPLSFLSFICFFLLSSLLTPYFSSPLPHTLCFPPLNLVFLLLSSTTFSPARVSSTPPVFWSHLPCCLLLPLSVFPQQQQEQQQPLGVSAEQEEKPEERQSDAESAAGCLSPPPPLPPGPGLSESSSICRSSSCHRASSTRSRATSWLRSDTRCASVRSCRRSGRLACRSRRR